MNLAVNELIQSIAGKTSLRDCSLSELQQLTNQYPYFGPAQFLLVKKLKEENSSLLKEYIGKVGLYFQDSLWYHQLLHEPVGKLTADHRKVEDETAPWPPVAMESPATFEEVVDQTEHTIAENQGHHTQPELFVEIPKPIFEPIDVSKTELTFEPYHTVDYFASQGIKPPEGEKLKEDRFTVQLKSFTEWLKVMKRVPESEIGSAVSATDEKKVEHMAERSINDREVVTETMAEVWEKQGNHEKAKETYEKLSLLNPAKSSYFAAKIEHLKNL